MNQQGRKAEAEFGASSAGVPKTSAFEARYKALVDHLDVGIFVSTPDGRLLEANRTVARMAGYDSVEELLTAPARSLYATPADREGFVRALKKDGSVRSLEARSRRRDGSTYWVTLSAFVEKTADGSTTIVGIVQDIDARKRAEEALRRSETRYRQIVEMSPDAVALTRLDGSFVAVNRRFTELFGYQDVAELASLGMNSRDLVNEQDLVKFEASASHLQTEAYVRMTARVRRKDGTEFKAEFSACLIREDGTPSSFLTLIRDVSERDRFERALKQSEALLRESQHIARLGHYVYDAATDRWTSSEALDEIFGIDAEYDRTFANWLDLIHPEDQPAMKRFFEEEVLRGDKPFNREYRIVRRSDGETRVVLGLGQLQRDDEGRPVRHFGTIQDITEKKQIEEARLALEDQLRQSQKLEAIGLLAGGIAHDLNNLLTPILGNAELVLFDADLRSSRRKQLAQILEAGRRAQELVRQLMAFGRKQTLQVELLDFNSVISNFGGLLRRALREHIELSVDLRSAAPSVRADRSQIEQVLMNLAINAQDAMPDGGTLLIGTEDVELAPTDIPALPPGEYVRLWVKDSGLGMSAQTQERVFEPFFTTKEKGRGTGLGLATVYGIVRQHGGDIRVRSEAGEGTTFEVHLPVVNEPANAKQPSTRPMGVPRGHETILIAEDDRQARESTRALLEHLGYDVRCGKDVDEVVQCAISAKSTIHLLLTDVIMPCMNGAQVYEQVSKHVPGLRVLYMSGYASEAVSRHGVLDEGIVFLQKPFTLRELAEKVRQALDG
jgi:two-component system, cell cycle sensor histidine kinase and response regulator CckA